MTDCENARRQERERIAAFVEKRGRNNVGMIHPVDVALAKAIRGLSVSLDVVCPFCGEGDFDLPGLKHHLRNTGYCPKWDEVETITKPSGPTWENS